MSLSCLLLGTDFSHSGQVFDGPGFNSTFYKYAHSKALQLWRSNSTQVPEAYTITCEGSVQNYLTLLYIFIYVGELRA